MPTKVLLDTDIGSDIDDALCLAYLLANQECELLGVTTVSGDTQQRAALADALCRVAGKKVPIRAGLSEVILEGPGQLHVPQAEALERLEHGEDFPEDAIDFMRRVIRENPGEVTLLSVGPMTNIGLLFTVDPEVPKLLKQAVFMAGRFLSHGLEWNVICDPLAAALVYHRAPRPNLSVGLDVTTKCRLSHAEVQRRFQGELLEAAGQMAEVWFRERDVITFHDPLAAALIFRPELAGYQTGKVTVDVHSQVARGLTFWHPDKEGQHQVAVDVNPEAFFEHYFSITTA